MNNINKVVKITQKTSLLLIITIMVFGLWTGIASATLSITTRNATNINSSNAVLNGFVNFISGDNLVATAYFEWGTSTNFTNAITQSYYGNNIGNYSTTIGGLNTNTVYYFRAVVQNSQGRVYGNILSFRTAFSSFSNTNQAVFPELRVTTNLATNISSTRAQLNGLVTNKGFISSNTYFEWGKNNNLTNRTKIISTGAFPIVKHINKLTGLTPNTTYYFRVIADNGFSSSIGTTTYFTTSSATVRTDNTKTKEPTNTATVNSGEQKENNLSASIINANFLPGNLFDWLLLIIFILTLILLTQHIFPPVVSKQKDNEQY